MTRAWTRRIAAQKDGSPPAPKEIHVSGKVGKVLCHSTPRPLLSLPHRRMRSPTTNNYKDNDDTSEDSEAQAQLERDEEEEEKEDNANVSCTCSSSSSDLSASSPSLSPSALPTQRRRGTARRSGYALALNGTPALNHSPRSRNASGE